MVDTYDEVLIESIGEVYLWTESIVSRKRYYEAQYSC